MADNTKKLYLTDGKAVYVRRISAEKGEYKDPYTGRWKETDWPD